MDNIKGNKILVIFQRNERIDGYVNICNEIMKEIYSQEIIDKIGIIMMVTMVHERKDTTAKHNNNNTKIDNQHVFECLTNTVPQNTTKHNHKNQPQTHNIIQDLKFGMYQLVVWFQIQLGWQLHQTQPSLPHCE